MSGAVRVGINGFGRMDRLALRQAGHGVDVVIEYSGRVRTREALTPFFEQGVPKVVVAAPGKTGALNVVRSPRCTT